MSTDAAVADAPEVTHEPPPLNTNQMMNVLVAQSEGLLSLANEVWEQKIEVYNFPELVQIGEVEEAERHKQDLITQQLLVRSQTMTQILGALGRIQQMMYGIGVQTVSQEFAEVANVTQAVQTQHETQLNDIREQADEGLPRQPGGPVADSQSG